jgi:site-specific DNA-methyltransferase (adenine-specific)
MADNSVDCVITDPPYKIVSGGMTNQLGGIFDRRFHPNTATGKMFDHNEIKFSEWLPEVFRVAKEGSHTYIMTSGRNLQELMVESEKVGFRFQNLLVWDKGNVTPNRYYMQRTEFILLLKKGASRTINVPGTHNIISIQNGIGNKLHPTEKPIQLMTLLVANSTNEGELVLDPFNGSGTTTLACKNLKRNYIGIEINPDYVKIAQDRLKQGALL